MPDRRPPIAVPAVTLVMTTVTLTAVLAAQTGFDLGERPPRTIEIVSPDQPNASADGMLTP